MRQLGLAAVEGDDEGVVEGDFGRFRGGASGRAGGRELISCMCQLVPK